MEIMTYTIAWKPNEDDDTLRVYQLTEAEFKQFKDTILVRVLYRRIDPDRQIRKTVENSLVGFIEAPVMTLKTIDGLIHISGNVWRI